MDQSDFLDIFQKELLKKKGLRTAVLSTSGSEGVNSRTVVLRKYQREEHELIVFTHSLSQKVTELKDNPKACLLWYLPSKQIQIQIYVKGELVEDESITENYFNNINPHSLKDYLGIAPGSPYQENNDSKHFAVLRFEIEKYIFLKLDQEEHKKFQYVKNGQNFILERLIP